MLVVSHYFVVFLAKIYNNIFELVKVMPTVLSVPFTGHGILVIQALGYELIPDSKQSASK